jgi:hypothetical protein
MKRYLLLFAGLLFITQHAVFADESALSLRGSVLTDNRVRVGGGTDTNEWHEYRLDLILEKKQSDNAAFFAEGWVRSLGYPAISTTEGLMSKDSVAPWNFDLREAYFDLYNIVPNLDIRLGRQRVAWGRGDKINPTDNVNPYDLEDIWDFGRHLGSDGFKATYYAGEYTFTGALFPDFKPAVLPAGDMATALFPQQSLPAGLKLNGAATNIVTPENKFSSTSTLALKAAKKFLGYDFSLSYVSGRDDLPAIDRITLTPFSPGTVNAVTSAVFPRRQIIGLDTAGSIGNVGVWAEAAFFMPEDVIQYTDLNAFGMGTITSKSMDKNGYTKYLAGADYTFPNDMYLNVQYLHGFVSERAEDALENYLFAYVDWKMLNDKLTITPIGIVLNVKNLNRGNDDYSFGYLPQIKYSPVDNTELCAGYRGVEGEGNTTLGGLQGKDEIYFTAKFSF